VKNPCIFSAPAKMPGCFAALVMTSADIRSYFVALGFNKAEQHMLDHLKTAIRPHLLLLSRDGISR